MTLSFELIEVLFRTGPSKRVMIIKNKENKYYQACLKMSESRGTSMDGLIAITPYGTIVFEIEE